MWETLCLGDWLSLLSLDWQLELGIEMKSMRHGWTYILHSFYSCCAVTRSHVIARMLDASDREKCEAE